MEEEEVVVAVPRATTPATAVGGDTVYQVDLDDPLAAQQLKEILQKEFSQSSPPPAQPAPPPAHPSLTPTQQKKLFILRVNGHVVAIIAMLGTSVVVYFPTATSLLLENIEYAGVLIISICNFLAKFCLGYGVLMFTVVQGLTAWAFLPSAQRVLPAPILGLLIGTSFFAAIAAFDYIWLTSAVLDFYYQTVVNHTGVNSTALPDAFIQMANATQIPSVRWTLISCVIFINFVGTFAISFGLFGYLHQLKNQYETFLFHARLTPQEKALALEMYKQTYLIPSREYQDLVNAQELTVDQIARAIRNYRIDIAGGLLLFSVLAFWGNISFIYAVPQSQAFYLGAPFGLSVTLMIPLYIVQVALSLLTVAKLGNFSTGLLRQIVTRTFHWPEKKWELIPSVSEALITCAVVGMAAFSLIIYAQYSNLALPTVVVTGLVAAAQDFMIVLAVTMGVPSVCVKIIDWSLERLKNCCSRVEIEEPTTEAAASDDHSHTGGASELEELSIDKEGDKGDIERRWTRSTSPIPVVTSLKQLQSSSDSSAADDFNKQSRSSSEPSGEAADRGKTPDPLLETSLAVSSVSAVPAAPAENKTVTWGQWFGSFFKCSDGSRNKPRKVDSHSDLLSHLNAGQIQQAESPQIVPRRRSLSAEHPTRTREVRERSISSEALGASSHKQASRVRSLTSVPSYQGGVRK